ncbi:MAG: hypothetical protein MZU97_17655 [Bacillus subtilis]|nr:hypothetical protein [Bacillus subtilis]
MLKTTYDTIITIRTKIPGSFQIDYRFIEFASTSQEPTNLVDISMYDEENPIYVGDGIAYAYFLITIDHYGKYAVYMKRIFGNVGLTSDIYKLDGTKIEMVGLNWFNLDEGTYIVKQYFKYNQYFSIYYPYLHGMINWISMEI